MVLEDKVALDNHVVLLTSGERGAEPRIRIGAGTYINRFTMLDASDSIVVGQRCMIGPSCYITDHDHGTQAGQSVGSQPLTSAKTRIGNDVWIGAGAIVLKGVTVGDGAVIGAARWSRPIRPRGRSSWACLPAWWGIANDDLARDRPLDVSIMITTRNRVSELVQDARELPHS